jgi:hypothetical protein
MKKELFSEDYTIYWPKEYEGVVDFLQGEDEYGARVFHNNMEVIVFASTIGLVLGRQSTDIERRQRNEIAITTFLGRSEEKSLAELIYLVSLCDRDDNNVDLSVMRNPEGERRALEKFQRFAAGGLSALNDYWLSARTRTPQRFVYETIASITNSGAVENSKENNEVHKADGTNRPSDISLGSTVSNTGFDYPLDN